MCGALGVSLRKWQRVCPCFQDAPILTNYSKSFNDVVRQRLTFGRLWYDFLTIMWSFPNGVNAISPKSVRWIPSEDHREPICLRSSYSMIQTDVSHVRRLFSIRFSCKGKANKMETLMSRFNNRWNRIYSCQFTKYTSFKNKIICITDLPPTSESKSNHHAIWGMVRVHPDLRSTTERRPQKDHVEFQLDRLRGRTPIVASSGRECIVDWLCSQTCWKVEATAVVEASGVEHKSFQWRHDDCREVLPNRWRPVSTVAFLRKEESRCHWRLTFRQSFCFRREAGYAFEVNLNNETWKQMFPRCIFPYKVTCCRGSSQRVTEWTTFLDFDWFP